MSVASLYNVTFLGTSFPILTIFTPPPFKKKIMWYFSNCRTKYSLQLETFSVLNNNQCWYTAICGKQCFGFTSQKNVYIFD